VITSEIASLEQHIAETYYDESHRKLVLFGVTGTNGKTSISYLVKHLMDQLLGECGLIGTIEWIIGKNRLPSFLTTPDLLTNHKIFYEMVHSGARAAAMEVSSHALDQGRVRGIDFDVAIFSNLTLDHLDYHKTMQAYGEAKMRLFSSLKTHQWAVINSDDPWKEQIQKICPGEILTYGLDKVAMLRATHLELSPKGMRFVVHFKEQKMAFHSPLIGRFNVYNCLAAIGAALTQGFELEKIVYALQNFKKVVGRLESVPNSFDRNIYVDYAHTDDALKNILETLQEMKKGRIITVFGCGGSRDRTKRPKMAQVAEKYSDFVFVTSDNPRQEDPKEIIREILAGFSSSEKVWVEVDRKKAIEQAILSLTSEDILLIAGKGHENYQIFSHQTIDFDDRKVALEALDKLKRDR
jgi:UDP-N-acetylmuramoyl-L-alanyl-D-glutamate--2,6-diaminopimelate ligase